MMHCDFILCILILMKGRCCHVFLVSYSILRKVISYSSSLLFSYLVEVDSIHMFVLSEVLHGDAFLKSLFV